MSKWRMHDRFRPAPTTPGLTTMSNASFMCSCCGMARLAAGRRKVDRKWVCKQCFEKKAVAA